MRVFFAALALCALSFVAGVAGDLSTAPANAGPAVTLRLPPPIPADAPRAAPLVSTRAASAARVQPTAYVAPAPAPPAESAPAEAKPMAAHRLAAALPKLDPTTLAKAKERKQG